MVWASTRRLPSTAIEFADCATATVETATVSPAVPTKIPPRTARERVSPRITRTQSPMRNAPFIVLAAVTAIGPDRLLRPAVGAFYSVLQALQTKLPAELSLSPHQVASGQRL